MDKYHIYEEIGKGQFSQVFKVRREEIVLIILFANSRYYLGKRKEEDQLCCH